MSNNLVDDQTFVALNLWVEDAIVDLRYQSENNFLGRAVYDSQVFGDCFTKLRRGTAKKLAAAAALLRQKGYRLVIWDAYRPLAVQTALWEVMPDPRFVAPPNRGSRHNRGCAVDVTLADLAGNYLEMPSDFDDFTDRAKADASRYSAEIADRLLTLQQAMQTAGFELYEGEWWHFSDGDWQQYTVV